ncbi:MAG: dihydrofolate reductase, partial [Verrucomicrobiales bacterium]
EWNPTDRVDVEIIRNIVDFDSLDLSGDVFVIGGAEIYQALLPRCHEVLLSFVYAAHEGDTRFPDFEHEFEEPEIVERFDEFELRRYVRKD